MQFTKEQAVEKIKGNFTAKGEKTDLTRTINENVENLLSIIGENDELTLDDFVKKASPLVETALGLARKSGADAVRLYKEQHPEKIEDDDKDKSKDEKSALEKRLEALEAELNQSKQEKEIAEVRTKLLAKMKEKGINDDEWATSFISEVTLSKDTDIDAKAESYLKIYNKSKAKVDDHGTPRKPGEGGEHKNALDDVAKFMKANEQIRADIQ